MGKIKMGGFKVQGLDELQKELEKLGRNKDDFLDKCIKELAARLYAKVVERTPVGDYDIYVEVTAKRDSKNHKKGDKYIKAKSSGRWGGTLRRGWTIGPITKEGNTYKVDIINPVEYASYVEYGHRQEPGRYVPALGETAEARMGQGTVHDDDFIRGTCPDNTNGDRTQVGKIYAEPKTIAPSYRRCFSLPYKLSLNVFSCLYGAYMSC